MVKKVKFHCHIEYLKLSCLEYSSFTQVGTIFGVIYDVKF